MKALLILLAIYLGISLCSLSNALSPMQSVGEDFGKAWLAQNSNKFVTSSANNANDLWRWGGKPRGYEVFQGELYPLLGPTELYYPGFTTNTTPIYVNGTALMRDQRNMYLSYMPPYLSPYTSPYTSPYVSPYISSDFISDPWLLAQMTDRPVVVVYPAGDGKSTLL